MRVFVSPTATRDLGRIEEFLTDKNPAAAARAAQAIQSAILSLQDMSSRGVAVPEAGYRRLFIAFGRRGYILDYRSNDVEGIVLVLRVRHGREAR